MCYLLPRIIPFNPNGDNYPRFTSKLSKLRLREVKRLTNSNFPGTLPVLQLKVPCLRSPSVPGKLGHLVTLGVSNPPKELDPRDSSPDPMPIPKPFSTTLCCASEEIGNLRGRRKHIDKPVGMGVRSGLEEGGHGEAALKSGQPWVTAAESSHLGGRMLLGDMPGEDKQRLFYSPLFIPGGVCLPR